MKSVMTKPARKRKPRYGFGMPPSTAKHLRSIPVELDQSALDESGRDEQTVAREMRAYWLAEQVRDGRMGFTRAASLAQMPVGAFLRLLGRLRVPVLEVSEDELLRQLQDAREAG